MHVVDPFGIVPGWRTSSYNVFDELEQAAVKNPDAAIAYAEKIKDALIVRSTGGDNPFWDDTAGEVVEALILYVLSEEPPERRSLVRVRQLLTLGDVEAHRRRVRPSDDDRSHLSAFDVLLPKMASVREGPFQEKIAGMAATLLDMADVTRSGVLTRR